MRLRFVAMLLMGHVVFAAAKWSVNVSIFRTLPSFKMWLAVLILCVMCNTSGIFLENDAALMVFQFMLRRCYLCNTIDTDQRRLPGQI